MFEISSDKLAEISSDCAVFEMMLEGSSGTAGFSWYTGGEKVREYLSQAGEIIKDEGTQLAAEGEGFAEDDAEQAVLDLMTQLTLPSARINACSLLCLTSTSSIELDFTHQGVFEVDHFEGRVEDLLSLALSSHQDIGCSESYSSSVENASRQRSSLEAASREIAFVENAFIELRVAHFCRHKCAAFKCALKKTTASEGRISKIAIDKASLRYGYCLDQLRGVKTTIFKASIQSPV